MGVFLKGMKVFSLFSRLRRGSWVSFAEIQAEEFRAHPPSSLFPRPPLPPGRNGSFLHRTQRAKNGRWKDSKELLECWFFPGRWNRSRDLIEGRNPPPELDTIEIGKAAKTQHAPSDLSNSMVHLSSESRKGASWPL